MLACGKRQRRSSHICITSGDYDEEAMTIDTGDVVRHNPTGEEWVVAYVKGDRLAWCGWPEGEGQLSDCTLVKAATDDERRQLLERMAVMDSTDSRCRFARWRLGQREP